MDGNAAAPAHMRATRLRPGVRSRLCTAAQQALPASTPLSPFSLQRMARCGTIESWTHTYPHIELYKSQPGLGKHRESTAAHIGHAQLSPRTAHQRPGPRPRRNTRLTSHATGVRPNRAPAARRLSPGPELGAPQRGGSAHRPFGRPPNGGLLKVQPAPRSEHLGAEPADADAPAAEAHLVGALSARHRKVERAERQRDGRGRAGRERRRAVEAAEGLDGEALGALGCVWREGVEGGGVGRGREEGSDRGQVVARAAPDCRGQLLTPRHGNGQDVRSPPAFCPLDPRRGSVPRGALPAAPPPGPMGAPCARAPALLPRVEGRDPPPTARFTLLRYISTTSSAGTRPVFLTVTLTQKAAEL
jgi:hypothetical protein